MDDRAAIAALRAEANPQARAALIGAFVRAKEPLIRVLAEKYARIEKTAASLEDIHQAGRVGLVKAIETWDPEAGALSTWAGWKIRRCVQDLAQTEQPIKLPQIRGTVQDRDRVIKALRENPNATADELGIKPGMLERIQKTIGLRFASVDMFGSGDEAPARLRRIERRITELGEEGTAEGEAEDRSLARSLVTLAERCMLRFGADAEDLIALLSRALGCSPPIVKPKPKKASHPCPTNRSLLTPRPLRRRTLRTLERKGGRLAARKPSPLAPSRRPLPPLPSRERKPAQLRTKKSSNVVLLPLKLSTASIPKSAPKCSPLSASSRKAA